MSLVAIMPDDNLRECNSDTPSEVPLFEGTSVGKIPCLHLAHYWHSVSQFGDLLSRGVCNLLHMTCSPKVDNHSQ